jgi:hypothetical protein
MIFLFFVYTVHANECQEHLASLEWEEQAFAQMKRLNIASNEKHTIALRYVRAGERLMEVCPSSISLDRRYTLQRTLGKIKKELPSYRIMSLRELEQYAITHPEERVVYKNGRIIQY